LAITTLCITKKQQLSIGGQIININLLPPPADHSTRSDFFTSVASNHKNIVAQNEKAVAIQDIAVTPHVLNDHSLITYLANAKVIDTCVGIFINLRNGRNTPTLTCILQQGVYSEFTSSSRIAARINAALLTKLPQLPNSIKNLVDTKSTSTPTRRTGRGGRHNNTPNGTPSSSFKNIPVHPSLASTKNNKFHVIINGQGGHATANIYFCHFDDSNLRSLVDGIPYSINRSYDNHGAALECFKQYYKDINNQEEIDFMNANAPLEASNLNNPCPAVRDQVGTYTQSSSNTKEYTWTYNITDKTIGALRHAASVRMGKLKLPPTDSYDFFDHTFTPRSITYPVTQITLGILQSHETPPTDSSYHPNTSQARDSH
jgi:hypothetical protein